MRESEGTEMLLLDEDSFKALPEAKRVSYLLQWLQNLPRVIRATPKVGERI